jgi:hypothetical protein
MPSSRSTKARSARTITALNRKNAAGNSSAKFPVASTSQLQRATMTASSRQNASQS